MKPRTKAIKKVMDFIGYDEELDFEEKLVLTRILNELDYSNGNVTDSLYVILLRLKYGSKQDMPKRWQGLIQVPREVDMAGNFLGETAVEEEEKKRLKKGKQKHLKKH